MKELAEKYLPNFLEYQNEFWISIGETLIMLFVSAIFVLIFGLIIGTILVVTRKGNILENNFVHQLLDKSINIFRSIPFVILITLLIPVTKIVMGTYVGVQGAIFPLVIGAIPFFVRQVDSSLSDVDRGVIEAAESMGLSPLEIIVKVYWRESIPQLSRAVTISIISLLGLTAMGGVVGGGGLGSFVVRYGHNRRFDDITFISVLFILIFVSVIQTLGDVIAKKTRH